MHFSFPCMISVVFDTANLSHFLGLIFSDFLWQYSLDFAFNSLGATAEFFYIDISSSVH